MKTSKKRYLKRIHVQSGVPDRLGRIIPGIFTVFVDAHWLREQMERASAASGRQSKHGAVLVEFQSCPNVGQAEYFAAQFKPETLAINGDPRSEDFAQ